MLGSEGRGGGEDGRVAVKEVDRDGKAEGGVEEAAGGKNESEREEKQREGGSA